jgi:hypothetical protein
LHVYGNVDVFTYWTQATRPTVYLRSRGQAKREACKSFFNLIISKTAPAVRTQRSTNTASVCSLDQLSMSRSAVAYVERIGRKRKYTTLVRKSEERTRIWKFMSESEDNIKIMFEVLLAEYNKTMIFRHVTTWIIKKFLLHRRQEFPHKHRGPSVELHCLASHKILIMMTNLEPG